MTQDETCVSRRLLRLSSTSSILFSFHYDLSSNRLLNHTHAARRLLLLLTCPTRAAKVAFKYFRYLKLEATLQFPLHEHEFVDTLSADFISELFEP